ncbi:MAG TPA: riboflavin synthase [Actinomycetota bacterium]|jgi:riboflavin synthase|nr:riboflavin synthase [Actinomycetota bacterium]
MFTGIIEELGAVLERALDRITVSCRTVLTDADVGSSIAVNGVCLTVVDRGPGHLGFDLSEETLRRTSLARLSPGDPVNLERPVTLTTRLGGHLVQGHVDGVGEVDGVEAEPTGGAWLTIRPPAELLRYLVDKGSVSVDGVSLTVAGADGDAFSVALIPHTLAVTTLGTARVGDAVNLEVDVLAKYVERLLTSTGERART